MVNRNSHYEAVEKCKLAVLRSFSLFPNRLAFCSTFVEAQDCPVQPILITNLLCAPHAVLRSMAAIRSSSFSMLATSGGRLALYLHTRFVVSSVQSPSTRLMWTLQLGAAHTVLSIAFIAKVGIAHKHGHKMNIILPSFIMNHYQPAWLCHSKLICIVRHCS